MGLAPSPISDHSRRSSRHLLEVARRLLVGKVAAAASWVVAAFYDLPTLNETTAISAPNLHNCESSADASPGPGVSPIAGSGIPPAWDNRRLPPCPGDPCPGFTAEPGRCWRMVYSKQLQATHCAGAPSWTGRWFSPRGDRWFRVGLSESPRGTDRPP
jgi:hypothetical protein